MGQPLGLRQVLDLPLQHLTQLLESGHGGHAAGRLLAEAALQQPHKLARHFLIPQGGLKVRLRIDNSTQFSDL